MARRILTTLVALLSALALTGCAVMPGTSAADAAEAEQVLNEANKAMDGLESLEFTLSMTGEAAGQTFTANFDGGGYLTGDHAGDMVLKGAIEGTGMPALTMGVISRGGTIYLNSGTGWQVMPGALTTTGAAADPTATALANFDITRFVRDVTVERHTTFLGEPVTKIVGKLDTQAMLSGMFDQLGGQLSGLGALGGSPEEMLKGIGDIEATLYVSEVTHYLQAAHVEMSIEAQGVTMNFDVDFSLTSVNEKVRIPKPPVVGQAA